MPDRSKVFGNTRVCDIEETESKVRVMCDDGTMHEGDLVVGADGVHSLVRDLMWKRMNTEAPKKLPVSEKQTIKAEYKALLGYSPFMPGLGDNVMNCVSFDNGTIIIFSQPDGIYYAANVKLPKEHTQRYVYPNRKRWTAAELDETAEPLLNIAISETLTFGDLWKPRIRGHLVSLEEGCLSTWSHSRIVLVGDAAHKVTPNLGYGGNLAMEDVVALANELHRAVSMHPNKLPSDTELAGALSRYAAVRIPRMRDMLSKCALLTRMQAYDNLLLRFVYRVILPYILGVNFLIHDACNNSADTPTLNYVPFVQRQGTMTWTQTKDPDAFVNDGKWKAARAVEAAAATAAKNDASHGGEDDIAAAKAAARWAVASSDPDVARMKTLVLPVVIGSLALFAAALFYLVGSDIFWQQSVGAKPQGLFGRVTLVRSMPESPARTSILPGLW